MIKNTCINFDFQQLANERPVHQVECRPDCVDDFHDIVKRCKIKHFNSVIWYDMSSTESYVTLDLKKSMIV